jgi:hypothetical protein
VLLLQYLLLHLKPLGGCTFSITQLDPGSFFSLDIALASDGIIIGVRLYAFMKLLNMQDFHYNLDHSKGEEILIRHD